MAAGVVGTRRGNRHPSIVPYETYETADRPLAIAAANERLFVRICEALGLPELATDERFSSNAVRVEHADELKDAFEAVLKTRGADHWLEVLRAVKVPAGPINDVDQTFALAEELGDGADGDGRRLAADPPAAARGRRTPADPPRTAGPEPARSGVARLAALAARALTAGRDTVTVTLAGALLRPESSTTTSVNSCRPAGSASTVTVGVSVVTAFPTANSVTP